MKQIEKHYSLGKIHNHSSKIRNICYGCTTLITSILGGIEIYQNSQQIKNTGGYQYIHKKKTQISIEVAGLLELYNIASEYFDNNSIIYYQVNSKGLFHAIKESNWINSKQNNYNSILENNKNLHHATSKVILELEKTYKDSKVYPGDEIAVSQENQDVYIYFKRKSTVTKIKV